MKREKYYSVVTKKCPPPFDTEEKNSLPHTLRNQRKFATDTLTTRPELSRGLTSCPGVRMYILN